MWFSLAYDLEDLLTQHSISATAYLDIEGSVGVKVAAMAAVALIYYGESR
jgi:hypothetical protein